MKSSASLSSWSQFADTPQLSDPACEWERRELLELAEHIMTETPSAWPRFQSWVTAVLRLSDNACKAFTPEAALTSLTAELRRLWMQTALQKMEQGEAAPAPEAKITPIRPTIPSGGLYLAHSRDADSKPDALEGRCPAMPAASEWAADHIVFSSAQGALASVLYWAIAQGFWSPKDAPHLTFAGANFDTQTLLDSFAPAGLTWGRAKNVAAIQKGAPRKSRVVLIEPAFCDESANVLDIAAFHKTWRKSHAEEATLVILDTTLTGPLFPIGELLETLEGTHAPIVINLRSGAELDQAGLELANVGVASVYRHKSSNAETHDFGARLRKARAAVGTQLATFDKAALQAPWFLDSDYYRRYTLAVFDNNARVADDLAGGGRLFANVLHPKFARSRCRWAQAPYTLLRLQEPTPENYDYLEQVIAYESRRRGIFFERGKGFGYRGHRFQAVTPDAGRGTPFLRVAMGARSTPSLERAIRLLRELAGFREFSQLVAQYEGVIPRAAAVH